MKQFLLLAISAALITASLSSCNKGLVISGQLANATQLQVFFDEVFPGSASAVLQKVDMGTDGQFSFTFEEKLPAGIYQLRFGAKRLNLVLDGSESKVNIKGDLQTLQTYDGVTIEGSPTSQTLVETMQNAFASKYKHEDIAQIVETTPSPHLAAFIAYVTLQTNFVETQKKALARLQEAAPGSQAAQSYATYLSNVEQQMAYQQAQAMGPIAVGMEAPNISMKSPDGKTYALADLKGKVVLLDFWASWCGPCRRENPNVVRVYNTYKDQGFTVFSVSLDGIDSRSKAAMSPAQYTENNENQRLRWVNAIQQDGLIWPYHVSELTKWEAPACQLYGVNSIPRTFLIDREGKIAAVNLRGAEAIEAALKQLL